jgi:hypothetical protein
MASNAVGAVVEALAADAVLCGSAGPPPVAGLLPSGNLFFGEMKEEAGLPWVLVEDAGEDEKWVTTACALARQKVKVRAWAAAGAAGAASPTQVILDRVRAVVTAGPTLPAGWRLLWSLERSESRKVEGKRAPDDARVLSGEMTFEIGYEKNV